MTKNTETATRKAITKLTELCETELMKTFYYKFEYLTPSGHENVERIKNDIELSHIPKEKIYEKLANERYFFSRIEAHRTKVDYYIQELNVNYEYANIFPSTYYSMCQRLQYQNKIIQMARGLNSLIIVIKKCYPDVKLKSYDKYIEYCNEIIKRAENWKDYDRPKRKELENKFLNMPNEVKLETKEKMEEKVC